MTEIKTLDKEYVANTYNRFPVEIVSGKGSYVYDENGKEYIDMGSGIGVTSFGISDDVWQEAIKEQLSKVQHMSNLYYTQPCVKLAQLLCEKTGFKKVFFGNSGAEANECAIKVARKYAQEKKGDDYYTIITLKNSFHGRTITTLSATGQDHFHKLFNPLTDGFIHTEAGNIEMLKELVATNKVAGIMLECVQGEGGVIPLDADYVKEVAKIAEENDIILIIDEVQTGNGRTGYYYAYQAFGIEPDIVSTAKGLGGGLPIGAVMFGEKTENTLVPGDHGSTFGMNPVCCAGACAVLQKLDEALLADVKKKSAVIFEKAAKFENVASVTGMGLMIGIELKSGTSKAVAVKCLEKGLIVLTAHEKVRLLPPLNITEEQLEKGLAILEEAIKEVAE